MGSCKQIVLLQYYSSRFCQIYKKYESEKLSTAGTMQDVKLKLQQIMGINKGYREIQPTRGGLLQYIPKNKEDLPTRKMQDSYVSALIPLSKQPEIQDKYVTSIGGIRIGRLLEEMDLFAVLVVHTHILNPKLPKGMPTPYTVVTALVDRIDFDSFIPKPNKDIRLSGHVSWVGISSVEVVVWLEQQANDDEWRQITRALFVMAVRDSIAEKSASVNPLVPTTDEEKLIFDGGLERRERRKLLKTTHVIKVMPDAEEQKLVHALFLATLDPKEINLKHRVLPQHAVWMENTKLSSFIFPHPEHRNLHNRVFGGFIMRNAMELSFGLGFFYSRHRPRIKSISDISFLHSVDISNQLCMHAHVVYNYNQFFQIIVYVESWNASLGSNVTSNTFHFTYTAPEKTPNIYPQTYAEAMMYVDARRHFYEVLTKFTRT